MVLLVLFQRNIMLYLNISRVYFALESHSRRKIFIFVFVFAFGVTVEQLWSLLDLGETLWKNLFRLFITVLILIPDENHI